MRVRALPALLAILSLLFSVSSRAAETYCVGGYEGTAPNVVAACDQPDVRRLHAKWHKHCWVRKGDECFVCYDENDNTCLTTFLLHNLGSYSLVNPYECARLGEMHTADNVVAHVIDGQPVTPPPASPPVRLEARLERISSGPYTAGD
jgi:hypothetical protein